MSTPVKIREHHDGAALPADLNLEADVVIVGTGAGGGMAAEVLALAGLRVVMLEEGAYRHARDFPGEDRKAFSELYFEGGARKTADQGISILQGRTVGGSTTVNWTASFPTPPQTLAHWRAEHGVQGLGERDLAPWIAHVQQRLGILPWALPPNANNGALARGAEKLGWRHGVIPRNVRGCQNLGYCGQGCPVNAKLGMNLTTVPNALELGAVLVSRVRAERVLLENGKAVGVAGLALTAEGDIPSGSDASRRRVTVRARAVVAAAGGINTPGLLLRSQLPDPHQRMGKRTFLHPVPAVKAIMPDAVDGFAGAPQSVYSDQFLWRDGVTGAAGYKLEVPPLQPLLALSGHYHYGADLALWTDSYRHTHAMIALLRDGFHADSPGGSVTLRDDGTPLLDYTLSDYLWEGVRHAYLSMAECQFAAGAKIVMPGHMDAKPYRTWSEAKREITALPMQAPNAQIFSAHVMGGCTMGADPRHAVVDNQGRHHQVPGLHVIDATVFPTSLGVNPQVTIYALSARNATLLARELGGTPQEIAAG